MIPKPTTVHYKYLSLIRRHITTCFFKLKWYSVTDIGYNSSLFCNRKVSTSNIDKR